MPPVLRLCIVLMPGVAWGGDASLGGPTGLLAVPTAEVQPEGVASFGASRHTLNPDGRGVSDNGFMTIGFMPGLEFLGRVAEGVEAHETLRDLSFDAKYSLDLPWGAAIAVGAQDIGGEARNFRSRYAVGTLPWRALRFSVGYGFGPDALDGPFGGIEFRPWPYLGLIAEYDTDDVNAGVKLSSGPLLDFARLNATAAYRAALDDVEYGAHVVFPLGRSWPEVASTSDRPPPPVALPELAPPPPATSYDNATLRTALAAAGFERVRVGLRPPATQVVLLENRAYNHSSADGIGVALGIIARHAAASVQQIELTVSAYGVPLVTVAVPAALFRAYLEDPARHGAELRAALEVRHVDGLDHGEAVAWDPAPTPRAMGPELMIEPVLRTFVGTEYGLIDYGLGVRTRATLVLGGGVLVHAGLQAPVLLSDDFRSGQNFAASAPEGGLDLLLLQMLHKVDRRWTWLWSVGRLQVLRTDFNTAAQEQYWATDDGAHQLRTKLAALNSAAGTRTVALAGYTWFDAGRDYSVGLTAGRFYGSEGGWRLDASRYFGDTIVTASFRAASGDDQLAGLQISLPLTPRRDGRVKGQRRWSHGLSTTVNADGVNPLRPLLLYEPQYDMDLRRDFFDAGRLGGDYLRDELPRMREAYGRFGAAP